MEKIITITINKASSKPKYEQIVDVIISSIELGKLKKGQQLPSIAKMASEQQLSKATVAKSYDALCERGIVMSKHGKGFYVSKTSVKTDLNIFLLFDTFNHYKEILYTAFKKALPESTQYSIFFHYYNLEVFKNLIKESVGRYTHFVILPHFKEDISEILNYIPGEKLLVLDQHIKSLNNETSNIYQPFQIDIINALTTAKVLIKKYLTLHLILGKSHFQYVPEGIISGFKLFMEKNDMKYSVQEDLDISKIQKQEAYLLFSDIDMIQFVKAAESRHLKIGHDVGMISYDDTPLKEILLGGVSVISTDFENMGYEAAKAILSRRVVRIENPGGFIKRKTL